MISVVIPFFRAKKFIENSIESAIHHKVVSEIIVIYDGCDQISFEDLRILLLKFEKVKLVHHNEFLYSLIQSLERKEKTN